MPVDEVLVDDLTRARLGESGLAELRRRFGRGDCLACERPLRSRVAVVVDEFFDMTRASAYHPQCHQPAWIDSGPSILPRNQAVSYRCRLFLGPDVLSRGGEPIPWFLVHPSLEILGLKPTDSGSWASSDLDLFQHLGFVTALGDGPLAEPDGIVSLSVRRSSVVVTATAHRWSCRGDASTMRRLHRMRGAVVAVTTVIDPAEPFTLSALRLAVESGECALGWVRVSQTIP